MKLTFNKVMMMVYYVMAILIIMLGVFTTDDELLSTVRMILGVCLFIAGMLLGREK